MKILRDIIEQLKQRKELGHGGVKLSHHHIITSL